MSTEWANRQRNTNKLVRKIASYLFNQKKITAAQLYGVSKLSWITKNNKSTDASYIKSTKIPALAAIFQKNYDGLTLQEVAEDIATIVGDAEISTLVQTHTGYTNFYNAFRNSSLQWIEVNFKKLLPLYLSAYSEGTDLSRAELIRDIAKLPKIPKGNNLEQTTKPENLLTPTFFTLDREIRFPIINGNQSVTDLLKALDVDGSDLYQQFSAVIKLYGVGGIKDAADLDQIGKDLPDFIDSPEKKANKKLLESKVTGNNTDLTLKDESDVVVLQKSITKIQRRIHNELTNEILSCLSSFTLLEGRDDSCMFDVLVRNYDGENDLLIEVKSSTEKANIRMAIGQLLNYWYELKGKKTRHVAILLPEKPDEKSIQLLDSIDIGLLWFESKKLYTSTHKLNNLASLS
jgi:hypothetical protein